MALPRHFCFAPRERISRNATIGPFRAPDADLFKDDAGNYMILDQLAHTARLWVPTDLWPD
jgi:hypothetical protein